MTSADRLSDEEQSAILAEGYAGGHVEMARATV